MPSGMTRLNLTLTSGVMAIYLFLSSGFLPCVLRAAGTTYDQSTSSVVIL